MEAWKDCVSNEGSIIRGATVKIGTREVQSQEPDSEEGNSVETESEVDTGAIPESDDAETPTPGKPTDEPSEPALHDAPRRSQHAAAQTAGANRMAYMYELEDN